MMFIACIAFVAKFSLCLYLVVGAMGGGSFSLKSVFFYLNVPKVMYKSIPGG